MQLLAIPTIVFKSNPSKYMDPLNSTRRLNKCYALYFVIVDNTHFPYPPPQKKPLLPTALKL